MYHLNTGVQRCRMLAGRSDEALVPVQSDHGPRRAHSLGEQIQNPIRPAAKLESPRSWADLELIKQPPSFARELLDLPAETFSLSRTALQ
jgi:hypothetical protein